jgi:aspartate carbamoyltransferase catalytic subunit
MRNLVNILDLTKEEIDDLVRTASDIMENPDMYSDACRGKILGTLFFEPSTRTRLSFTSAMMGLGGNVLGFSQAGSSSVSKGETVSDTIRMVSAPPMPVLSPWTAARASTLSAAAQLCPRTSPSGLPTIISCSPNPFGLLRKIS